MSPPTRKFFGLLMYNGFWTCSDEDAFLAVPEELLVAFLAGALDAYDYNYMKKEM